LSKTQLEKAMAAISEGRPKEAISLLEKELKSGADDVEMLVYLGIAYVQAEQPERAVKVLEKAEEEVEDHCILSLFLGRAYKALGRYEDAVEQLTRAISIDPEILEAWIDLGEIQFKQANYGAVARTLEDAVVRFPEETTLHNLRAMAFHKLGDYTEAAREWETVYSLSQDSLIALTNYTYSILLMGRTEEAAQFVERARRLSPGDYRTRVLEAEYAFQLGRMKEAKSLFISAVNMMPDSIEVLGRLAVLHHLEGDTTKASSYLKKAKALAQKEPDGWQRLCPTLQKLETHDELLACLKEATRRDIGSAAAWIHLACEYVRRGLTDDALEAWKQSFELRGYIKVHCKVCGKSFTIPYDARLDLHGVRETSCAHCGDSLAMPESLAKD